MAKLLLPLKLSENQLTVELLTPKELIRFNLKNKNTKKDDYFQGVIPRIVALRDWCNQVIEELESEKQFKEDLARFEALQAVLSQEQETAPERVLFEEHFAEVRKRIGQVGFKEENQ